MKLMRRAGDGAGRGLRFMYIHALIVAWLSEAHLLADRIDQAMQLGMRTPDPQRDPCVPQSPGDRARRRCILPGHAAGPRTWNTPAYRSLPPGPRHPLREDRPPGACLRRVVRRHRDLSAMDMTCWRDRAEAVISLFPRLTLHPKPRPSRTTATGGRITIVAPAC